MKHKYSQSYDIYKKLPKMGRWPKMGTPPSYSSLLILFYRSATELRPGGSVKDRLGTHGGHGARLNEAA